MTQATKNMLVRCAAIVTALVLLFAYVPDVIPTAKASGGVYVPTMQEVQYAQKIIDLMARVGALEKIMGLGTLTGAALAAAQAELAALKATLSSAVAASGLTAKSAVSLSASLALAGIVVSAVDWEAAYNKHFNTEAYQSGYLQTDNAFSNWVVNDTNIDEWATSWITAMGIPEAAGIGEWDYVEMNNKGWNDIYNWAKNTFGTQPGASSIPALGPTEALNMMNASFIKYENRKTYYEIPFLTYFSDQYGQYIYGEIVGGKQQVVLNYMYPYPNGTFKLDTKEWTSMVVVVADDGRYINGISDVWIHGGKVNGTSVTYSSALQTTKAAIGIAETPYTNDVERIGSVLPQNDDGKTAVTFPPIETAPGASDYEQLYDFLKGLNGWETAIDPDEPLPSVCPDTLPGLLDHLDELLRGIGAWDVLQQLLGLAEWVDVNMGRLTEDDISSIMDVLNGIDTWAHEAENSGTLTGEAAKADAISQEIDRLIEKYPTETTEPTDPGNPPTIFAMFPFCLPWDVLSFFEALAAPPKEPRFEVDIFGGKFGGSGKVVIDFSMFDDIRRLVRNCILIVLIVGLLVSTKNYIWTGGG